MTQTEIEKGLEALDNLDKALVDRVSALSETELLAEMIEDGFDPQVEAEFIRTLSVRAAARSRMVAAKAAVASGRNRPAGLGGKPLVPANDFQVARGMTMAARNGTSQSEADIQSLVDDMAELHGPEDGAK